MSFANGVRPPHLADEDLLRHIDRQLDLEGSRRVRTHLLRCEECSARAEQIRTESRAVSALLAEIPVRMPDPSRRALALAAMERAGARRPRAVPLASHSLLRAAALVGLLFLVAMTTQPVRAWVGDRVERLVGPRPGAVGALLLDWLGREEAPAVPALGPVAAAPAEAPTARPVTEAVRGTGEVRARVQSPRLPPAVAFAARGTEVWVEFSTLQDAGSARFVIRDVAMPVARVVADPGGERMEAAEGGLRIRNAAVSRAQYEIVVPAHFRRIRVRVAGGEAREMPVSPSTRAWTFDLRRGPRP